MPELTSLTPAELAEEIILASGRFQGFAEAVAIVERAAPLSFDTVRTLPELAAALQSIVASWATVATELEQARTRLADEVAAIRAKIASLPSTSQH